MSYGIIDTKQIWNLIVVRAIQIYKRIADKGLFTHKPERLVLAQNWIKGSREMATSGSRTW